MPAVQVLAVAQRDRVVEGLGDRRLEHVLDFARDDSAEECAAVGERVPAGLDPDALVDELDPPGAGLMRLLVDDQPLNAEAAQPRLALAWPLQLVDPEVQFDVRQVVSPAA
jgi:hypothetical protein